MKRIISILFFSFYIFSGSIYGQDIDTYNLFLKFNEFYRRGDFLNCEASMISVLNLKKNTPESYIVAAFNNLGATNTILGKYREALFYYNNAETLISNNLSITRSIADIYINKATIYGFQKSYTLAIDYFEKGIRIYTNLKSSDTTINQSLSSAYLNIGVVYYEVKDYKTASDYLNKSAELKLKYNLTGLALVYLNIAKISVKTGDLIKAEEFYLRSISGFQNEFGKEYYRMAEVYFDYGLFLRSVGRNSEALDAHRKALAICLKNYGEKHTLVSLAYKHIGDSYLNQNSYDSALYYYQKSLIAVVKDFSDPDIFANPSTDSAIFDIRLLDNLKSKAMALELLAVQQNAPGLKLKTTQKGVETIELAMQLIDRIRNNYLTEESRIYLAENEKETYIFAIDIARDLFDLTHNDTALFKMYNIAKKAKAAVLRNEITENELVYSAAIPDSLRKRQNTLSGNISAYNNLILEEMRKVDPDNKKISLWKDALFAMNREKEKVSEQINMNYPQLHDLLQKTEPVTLGEIQKHLSREETVIDYLLSNQYTGGKRKMFIFLITNNRLEFREESLDSVFIKSFDIIRSSQLRAQSSSGSTDLYRDYTASLFYMYDHLIRPVEPFLSGNRLIIIPDEEIGLLPFDAFLRSKPAGDQTDFEGLHYLINDYAFSFGYSSSLIFKREPESKGGEKVFAFLPDYSNGTLRRNGPDNLQGAKKEIDAIFKSFKGRRFTGEMATEANFREAIKQPVILHLAMHSLSDSADTRYSYMMFDHGTDSLDDGKLYNYEISLSRIKSPMVVLSACNSGTGTLYHGEGLMSLARGFILAGVSSVIKTAWEVNDEASAAVIGRFYFYFSKGKPKDVAMRLAKLDYIKSSPPVYSNPYYWAAYEVLGDSSKFVRKNVTAELIIVALILIMAAGIVITYFKRRSIAPDPSL